MNKIYLVVILILSLSITFLVWQNKNKQNKINAITAELEVSKNEKPQTIVVHDTKIEYKYKDGKVITKDVVPEGYVKFDLSKYDNLQVRLDSLKNNQTSIKDKLVKLISDSLSMSKDKETKQKLIDSYTNLMRDNNAEILKLQALLNKPETYVTIKNKGFCILPEIGVGYTGKLDGYIGIKIAYWNKYGLSIGSTSSQAGIGISRYVYDIIPFTKNTQVMVLGGLPYKQGNGKIFIGLKVGL